MSRNRLLLSVVAMALLLPALAMAQDAGGQNNDNNRRQRFDPAQFRQRMAERMKAELKVTDEEWAVLQPKIEKVQTLERDLRMGTFGGMMGRMNRRGGGQNGGTGGPGADNNAPEQPQSEIAKAAADLRTSLDDESATAEVINQKLLAYRTAKAKVQTDIDVARKDLKELLTPRQEAVLVMNGVLE